MAPVSDHRVRGLSQTSFRPALQGGVDFTHKSGFYAGAFASNVRWLQDLNVATKGGVEVDFYGGFRGTPATDWSYDAGVIRYEYVRNNSGDAGTPGAGLFTDASTTEAYLNVGFKMSNLKPGRHGHAGDNTDWSLSQPKDFGNGLVTTVTAGDTNAAKGAGSFYRDMKGRNLGRNYGLVGVRYSF